LSLVHYYVSKVVDAGTGQRYILGLARADDAETLELYSIDESAWVAAPASVRDQISRQHEWEPVLSQAELDASFQQLPEDTHRWLSVPVLPGFWLSVTYSDDEPKVLLRSADGRSLEGYAVSSAQWEPMPYPATPRLHDPSLWQPIAVDDVANIQVWLHMLWDLKELKAFDAQAPELIDPELTEVAVREAIVHYIVEILKLLPDGLTVGFQGEGRPALGVSSGPLGPGGSWNFQANYWVLGYPQGANDAVFDAFKRLFDGWGWAYRYEDDGRSRVLAAWTDKTRRFAFHVKVTRYEHGGLAMTWTSPYYPAEFADTEKGEMRMPSVITKDGIQSWEPPVYHGSVSADRGQTDTGGFDDIVRYYDIWRRIVGRTRNVTYGPAEWEHGRLYFRSDYLEEHGDWAAWVIDPTHDGLYNVLSSRVPERSNDRHEHVEATFSRLDDAGKYIVAQLGNSARMGLRLASLAIQWDDSGLGPLIEVTGADSAAVDYLLRVQPSTVRHVAEEQLQVYRLREDPGIYAFAFPSKEPYMHVLAVSFEELNRSLLDGIPDSDLRRR
jgi:hypothetical protein